MKNLIMMADLRDDIPVTYEFEDYIPPEEDGVIFEEPARQWQTTAPDVASTFNDEKPRGVLDEEKREAFVRAGQASTSRRTMSDVAQASSGAERNNDSANGGSPSGERCEQFEASPWGEAVA